MIHTVVFVKKAQKPQSFRIRTFRSGVEKLVKMSDVISSRKPGGGVLGLPYVRAAGVGLLL